MQYVTVFFWTFVFFMSIGAANSAGSKTQQLTVAFIGDQGISKNARAVLQLVADEGADLLLIQGDLGYGAKAAAQWIRNTDDILGTAFPVLVTVGNHENYEWPLYRQWLIKRIRENPELVCEGNPGVKAHCSFRNLSILQVAAGVDEVKGVPPKDAYADYLESELSSSLNVWRICSWHKNQQNMQVGGKLDETGWEVYTACMNHGGIVATAHEHSYSRTFLMKDFKNQKVVHRSELMEIGPGRTFAFVSGLGGHSIRPQRKFEHWWASVYTATQNASHGALFCTFANTQGNCQFKDVNGVIADFFRLENRNIAGEKIVRDKLLLGEEVNRAAKLGSMSDSLNTLTLIILSLFVLVRSLFVADCHVGVREVFCHRRSLFSARLLLKKVSHCWFLCRGTSTSEPRI